MENLTQKQREILEFIERELEENNSPSQKEMAAHFGLAQNAVFQLVSYLKKKGYLANSSVHRGLRLSERVSCNKTKSKGLPIVGRVAAGEPILAEQNITGYMDIGELIKETEQECVSAEGGRRQHDR